MTDISEVVTPERYSQGFTYEDYLAQMSSNRERYQEHDAAFVLSKDDGQAFKDINNQVGGVKSLAIVEDWCPDAHRGLPVLARIARASGMELRVFYRDKNPDIMNLYLKEGKFQSIPAFAFFDKNMRPLCHWIERPEAANRFMAQISYELSKKKLTEEEMRQERRKQTGPMAEKWRQETVKELKELLIKAIPKN
jgi:hypothetical protein